MTDEHQRKLVDKIAKNAMKIYNASNEINDAVLRSKLGVLSEEIFDLTNTPLDKKPTESDKFIDSVRALAKEVKDVHPINHDKAVDLMVFGLLSLIDGTGEPFKKYELFIKDEHGLATYSVNDGVHLHQLWHDRK